MGEQTEQSAVRMKRLLRFDEAELLDVADLNGSFGRGRLRVMYTGANQNGTEFSRDVVEAALPSLANIPIVAHYMAEENTIGSHDAEVVRTPDGGLMLRNLTEPCGVVPESATAWFAEEADDSGVKHEYLNIEPVILWKRQEVYRHITEDLDGHVDHSMEVNITSYHKDRESSVLTVDSFEFEALCLLETARPCFEGSALDLFSANEFRAKMAEMMKELREVYAVKAPATGIDDSADGGVRAGTYGRRTKADDRNDTEGGNVLDEKTALLEEYGLEAGTLGFSLDDFSLEELREKFDAMKAEANNEPEAAEAVPATYELASNLRTVLAQAFQEKQVMRPWGMDLMYWYRDHDAENSMAYAESLEDGNIYGFPYSMNGDRAVIDFDAGKRMKMAYVEFDAGQEEPGAAALPGMFANAEAKYAEAKAEYDAAEATIAENEKAWTEKYGALEAEFNELKEATADIEELRSFKADTEQARKDAEREDVFAAFCDLEGNEAFEALRENSADYELEALEKECYAIRGMLAAAPAKFAAKEKTPRLKVVRSEEKAEKQPYGGLFDEFGPHRK